LLTHYFPLAAAAEAFHVADTYVDGALKVTITPSETDAAA
jgi:hypothetical protein